MTDERLKQLMEQVGMPNSRSLYQALQQAEMEGAARCDAEVAELKRKLNEPVLLSEWQQLEKERDQLREQVKILQSAVKNLRDVKGRHHSEIAYKRLIEALAATEPK